MQRPGLSVKHSEICRHVSYEGFAIANDLLDRGVVSRLCRLFESSSHGERNLLELSDVCDLTRCYEVRELVSAILGRKCFAVRAILFDKTPETNWNVVWHQDRVIAVQQRKDSYGFRGWSMKAGVYHVQPPADIVGGMLALRLHLDDCGESNGPLQVIPGSHKFGFIADASLRGWKEKQSVTCAVKSGDAILMRPLLLHSSLKSVMPQRRRVIHIEFASCELPDGLQWHSRVA
jgi:ectoine hydroxylase-related dioxygenase (phytanoyl-CoA dioxygenase family)